MQPIYYIGTDQTMTPDTAEWSKAGERLIAKLRQESGRKFEMGWKFGKVEILADVNDSEKASLMMLAKVWMDGYREGKIAAGAIRV